MPIQLDGERHDVIPIRVFRAAHDLPPDFGVAYFQPKSYAGLGNIDGAGAALTTLRDTVLTWAHEKLRVPKLSVIPDLYSVFARALTAINDQVGLKDVEIEFAAAGFSDMIGAFMFALVRASVSDDLPPDFVSVYQAWLDTTTHTASPVIEYVHGADTWGVQVIADAYGRVGLIVALEEATVVVQDSALACPAAGFMAGLMREVCAEIGQNSQ